VSGKDVDGTGQGRLAIVQRGTGIAALVAAGSMFVALVFNFAIIQPIMDVIGADGFAWGFGILFWLDLLRS
jgi:hypothetical protein